MVKKNFNSSELSRRKFLEFLGLGAVGVSLNTTSLFSQGDVSFKGIKPSSSDEVVLAEGLNYDVLIKWGDSISKTDFFGTHNDYLAFIPINKKEGLLWVNHESITQKFVTGFGVLNKTKQQVDKERYNVGGSILKLFYKNSKWHVDKNSNYNRRITAATKIPFNWPEKILGQSFGIGTLGNCAGGVTPWNTILTCEENYQYFYGKESYDSGKRKVIPGAYQWNKYYNYAPEHYGWVVEIDPFTGDSQKLIGLGRCAHECATVVKSKKDKIVVYMGDDSTNECIYKYISAKNNSLQDGILYVANIEKGEWIPLDLESNKKLKNNFRSQTDLLINLRKAAKIVGGTPLDRPEDIEIDKITGHVFISLTGDTSKNNFHGSILKIKEQNGDYCSLKFNSEVFLTGGKETGFSCPDNLIFDDQGNLWFTSDISGSYMNKKEPYLSFKNNGLFVVKRNGNNLGKVIQIASAPIDAEFTGPFFSPDYKTLFLSVQHPGQYSKKDKLTSTWPSKNNKDIPRSAVITISGELLNNINKL